MGRFHLVRQGGAGGDCEVFRFVVDGISYIRSSAIRGQDGDARWRYFARDEAVVDAICEESVSMMVGAASIELDVPRSLGRFDTILSLRWWPSPSHLHSRERESLEATVELRLREEYTARYDLGPFYLRFEEAARSVGYSPILDRSFHPVIIVHALVSIRWFSHTIGELRAHVEDDLLHAMVRADPPLSTPTSA